jgi:parallel beta-helix repeat protein
MPRLGIFAFAHQGGNVIEYNHIHHVCLESDDAGAIHLNSAQDFGTAVTYLRNNLIHDVEGPRAKFDGSLQRTFGFGIYLDGANSNCVISNNVIYRTSSGTVFLNGGKNNIVENNILLDDVRQQVWASNYLKRMSGNVLRRNIIVAGRPATPLLRLLRFDKNVFAECDHNLFWQPDGEVIISSGRTLEAWQSQGYDTQSRVADPRFADPGRDDYSLRADSPALPMGFTPIDLTTVGPRADRGCRP